MPDSWRDQLVLDGQHVHLRPMVRADGPAIVEAASDGCLWDLFYTAVPGPDTIEAYLDTAERETAYGRAMPFVVIDKASGQIVGATRYMRMKAEAKRLEIGATFYAQSAQRSPINTEAKLLLLSHAFEVMQCQCVQFRTDAFNFASQRAIERLGAKRDGLLRNHSIMNGRNRDTVVYSILAHEWNGVKTHLRFRLERA
jgi:N-acetyltransferase